MNYLNSVFVVLLVILLAVGAFGFLINEALDLRKEIVELRTQNAELEARLEQQASQFQGEVEGRDRLLAEQQISLEQCNVAKQALSQDLDVCAIALGQAQSSPDQANLNQDTNQTTLANPGTQPQQQSRFIQVETQEPIWATLISENAALLVGVIGGSVVVITLALRIKVNKLPDDPRPEIISSASRIPPKQVTIKMNSLAYQDYLDYLKTRK
jgi:hypothetical protein